MRVAIVGGGIAGFAAAIALARSTAFDVVVYERHAGVDPGIGLAVNLAPNGMRAVSGLGLAEEVVERGCELRTWVMRHSDGEIITEFPLTLDRDHGYPMVALRRDLLIALLATAARAAGVELRVSKDLARLEDRSGGVRLHFTDRSTAEADAVVACDGVHSGIKAQLFGPSRTTFTGQGQSFGISRPEGQYPLMRNTFLTTLGSQNYLGGYDIGRGDVLWFVGYNLPNRTMHSGGSSDLATDVPLRVIQQMTGGWHDPVPELIADTFRYGARATEQMAAPPALHHGRVVLVGDAAYPVQPHFGQGANLALEDSLVLAELLGPATGGTRPARRIQQAFEEYDRIRLPRRIAVADYSRQMGRRFHWTNPLQRRIRNLALERMGARIMESAGWIYGYDHRTALQEPSRGST